MSIECRLNRWMPQYFRRGDCAGSHCRIRFFCEKKRPCAISSDFGSEERVDGVFVRMRCRSAALRRLMRRIERNWHQPGKLKKLQKNLSSFIFCFFEENVLNSYLLLRRIQLRSA